MLQNHSLDESLHNIELLKSNEFFLKLGQPCKKIGKLIKGVMRGYTYEADGSELTTHFYQEGDVVIGSFVPNVNLTMNIQALEVCELSVASFGEVMSHVNKDQQITETVNREFRKLNKQHQTRLVSLLNLDSVGKYKLFLEEYPGLLNRIPHYYIAQYLGITPTQLSRARKQFSQQM